MESISFNEKGAMKMTKKLEKLKEVKPLRSLEFKPEFEHLKKSQLLQVSKTEKKF